MKADILVVDDERDICRALEFLLAPEGYTVTSANSGEEAVQALARRSFDVVITDLKMGPMDGIALLEEAKRLHPETQVILMTAYASVDSAVEAMKKGASDYIVKPFINEEVRITVRRLLEQSRLRDENIALKRELSHHRGSRGDIVFSSEPMIKIFDTLENIIPTKSNVLLLGESGTGKDLIASAIHTGSPRADKPFISITCTAIPETLLESELFGYKKGAFTGAVSDKKGLIQLADLGTLFLDEIADMPVQLQSKLLNVLETGEFIPLGDTMTRYSDIRLVSATNSNIEEKIKDGTFREDLYYRINVFEITIPPLRERGGDIELLTETFIKKYSKMHGKKVTSVAPEAMEIIRKYPWPGNVRELGNVIEHAVILANSNTVTTAFLPDKIRYPASKSPASLKAAMNEYEKKLILKHYEANSENKEATARSLGIDVATLYRKLNKYGLGGGIGLQR